MSNRALDIKTNAVVLAKYAACKTHYKCFNEKCTAVMVLRRGVTPCFTAIKSHPHIGGCAEASPSGITNYTLPLGFTIDAFIGALSKLCSTASTAPPLGSNSHKNSTSNSSVTTPKQLYDYCLTNCDLYNDICIDDDNSAQALRQYYRKGVFGGKVLCGFISHYLSGECLVVKISSKKQANCFLLVKLKMDASLYKLITQILLHRAHKIQEAKIIVCAQCVSEHTTSPFFKTNTTAYIESSQQIHVYLD